MAKGYKYYWENDWTPDVDLNHFEKNIELKPKGNLLKSFQFSDEIIDPIIETINEAISSEMRIGICGDYDADGVSATTILYEALIESGAACEYIIPNRFNDGYGLNIAIVDRFAENNVGLILTVDNGISAFDAIEHAAVLGIDVIVTDHHSVGDELPNAKHILHPVLDESLPFSEICGAAVAYFLAKKIAPSSPKMLEWLQLAAIATIADMMPIEHINRELTYFGYLEMKKDPILFLTNYLEVMEKNALISNDLGFGLIPMINSVGRMDNAQSVVDALIETDTFKQQQLIRNFIVLNEQRKDLTQTIFQEALEQIDSEKQQPGFQLVIGKNWHQGVLGIVAQRLMDVLREPVIVLTNTENNAEKLTGSARAFGGYNVYDCFNALQNLFEKFGGHQFAGGLTFDRHSTDEVKDALMQYNEKICSVLDEKEMTPTLVIDGWASLDFLNAAFIKQQEKYEPFGEGNKPYVIGIYDVLVLEINELGRTGEHVKLLVQQDGKKYPVVAFNSPFLFDTLATYSKVDLAVEAQRNVFNGVESVQYLLKDIKIPNKQVFDKRNIGFQEEVETLEQIIVVDEIPQNAEHFLAEIRSESVAHIILKKIQNEDLFMYEATIPETAFNYLYKVLLKKKELNLSDEKMFQYFYTKKLPKSVVLYIIQVFFELDFVIIEEYICKINTQNVKRDLSESNSYQNMAKWFEVRNAILFEPSQKILELASVEK